MSMISRVAMLALVSTAAVGAWSDSSYAWGGNNWSNSLSGTYQAQVYVAAVTPSPGNCGVTAPETISGIANFSSNGWSHGSTSSAGGTATFHLSVMPTGATSPTVWETVFSGLQSGNLTPSGTYQVGVAGGTLESGTYSSTYTLLDNSSASIVNQLSYTSPVDGVTACTETDDVTLISLNALSGHLH